MELRYAINSLRAVREFSSQEVPFDVIKEIVNAGHLSPSSRNSQPWRFLIIRDPDQLQRLSELGYYASHVPAASFCIVILTPNPEKQLSVMFDAGQAAALMQLVALEKGIGSCIVKLHEGDLASDLLGYPDEYKLIYAIAFGYPRDGKMFRPIRKSRKALSEVCFLERWGQSFD